MARNRQRAKERQAERRAARQAAGEKTGAAPEPAGDLPESEVEMGIGAFGAPPQQLGQPDFTLAHTSEAEEFIGDLEVHEPGEPDEYVEDDGSAAPAGPRGVRGTREREEEVEHHERGRVMGFLHAVWLELQRVQWPDRSTLTSLTGVTLAFVLIVGGYLGLLDAVFSKLVQAIL
ncbi:MAG: preprotein translocase subunit SecE [Thermoleophilaceae bacterium]